MRPPPGLGTCLPVTACFHGPRTRHTQYNTPSVHTGARERSGTGNHTQHNTPSVHTNEQEPSGQEHRTRNTTHRACRSVNRSQVAQETTHTAQHTAWAHRWSGAKPPRTPHRGHNTSSVHTGEQGPSGPGHRTHSTTRQGCTGVNRNQVAQDTAQATQHAEGTHR